MDAEDVEEYRRRAPHYLALAGETPNLAQRAALVDLAALCCGWLTTQSRVDARSRS
jgi:hypothetical protein